MGHWLDPSRPAAACGRDRAARTASDAGGTLVIATPGDADILLPPLVSSLAGAQITSQLYDRLAAWQRSPVVDLNRAVAVAMAEGPERGLELVQAIDGLDDYYLFHATRADLLRRLGEPADEAYRRALDLAPSEVERDFLRRRLLER